jgi:hypothetical protein
MSFASTAAKNNAEASELRVGGAATVESGQLEMKAPRQFPDGARRPLAGAG